MRDIKILLGILILTFFFLGNLNAEEVSEKDTKISKPASQGAIQKSRSTKEINIEKLQKPVDLDMIEVQEPHKIPDIYINMSKPVSQETMQKSHIIKEINIEKLQKPADLDIIVVDVTKSQLTDNDADSNKPDGKEVIQNSNKK